MVTPQGGPVITDPTDTTTDPEESSRETVQTHDGLSDSDVNIPILQRGRGASSNVDTLSKNIFLSSFASWTQDPKQNQSDHDGIQPITSRQSSIGSKNHNPNQNQSHHNDTQPITHRQSSIGSNTQDPNHNKTYHEDNAPLQTRHWSIGSITQYPNLEQYYVKPTQLVQTKQYSIRNTTQDPIMNQSHREDYIPKQQFSFQSMTQDPNINQSYHKNHNMHSQKHKFFSNLHIRSSHHSSKVQHRSYNDKHKNRNQSANNTKDITYLTMLRLQIHALFMKKVQSMIRSWTSSLTPILFFFLSVLLSKYFTTQTYAKPEDSWKITFDDYMPYDPIVVVGAHGQQSEKVQEIYKNMMESYEAEVEEVFIRYLVSFEICMYCVLNAYTIKIAKFAVFFIKSFFNVCVRDGGSFFVFTPPRNRGGVIFSLQFVCVCVCLSGSFLVNKIPAERIHRFGRGFR